MTEDRLRVSVVHLRLSRWRMAVRAADILSASYWQDGIDDDGDPDPGVRVTLRGIDDTIEVSNTVEEIEGWMCDS